MPFHKFDATALDRISQKYGGTDAQRWREGETLASDRRQKEPADRFSSFTPPPETVLGPSVSISLFGDVLCVRATRMFQQPGCWRVWTAWNARLCTCFLSPPTSLAWFLHIFFPGLHPQLSFST